ncbi:MAG TPA: hypothetical protein PKX93_04390, partial [bacterium]|nr:hypothetical protein [bacterium]
MKRVVLLICFLSVLIFTGQVQAKITRNEFISQVMAGQGILPNTQSVTPLGYTRHPVGDPNLIGSNAFDEGYIIILSHNVARDTEPVQRLTSVTVTVPPPGNLDVEST